MGYVHSYHQVKSVPNDQWLLLTTMVANVFLLTQYRFVPGFSDRMVICTADGKYPLLKPSELLVEGLDGQPAISFNGEERLDASYETFHLGQHSSGCGFCKTTFLWKPCRPYDFMVKATLLIAHRFCPGCYDINSDGTLDEWANVQVWLTLNLGGKWPIPDSIAQQDE
ncbi:TPA: hypothetical protein QIT95_005617 [Klebsiella michiganensis]|nr:hypothetical protein [Klebsiella michiganensis]ELS4625818.1 hypothetical protein [Klebsiella michiganensis]HCU0766824.1 hypothetical protein [Klebsiella michiganensis]HEP0440736.1 hypothetical protein [Klebsiella michiganensis]HEP0466823.1 hypothetical protein [Klebsiella michiganensis]